MYPIDPTKTVDFGEFKNELDGVFDSVSNRLERVWPRAVGDAYAQKIVLGHYRVSVTTYRTIIYFSAELPANDVARRPEFVVSAPPLVRSILDALANILFLFEDLTTRSVEYRKRGWKEDFDRANRYRTKYRDDPAWSDFFAFLHLREQESRQAVGVSDQEAATLTRWPTLGAMINLRSHDALKDEDRRVYLTFLNDWFYKEFSSDSHLSAPGLFRRAQPLFREERLWDDGERTLIAIYRTSAISSAIGLLLAMCAELEFELSLGLRERIVRIWSRLNHYQPVLEELYHRRAATLLNAD